MSITSTVEYLFLKALEVESSFTNFFGIVEEDRAKAPFFQLMDVEQNKIFDNMLGQSVLDSFNMTLKIVILVRNNGNSQLETVQDLENKVKEYLDKSYCEVLDSATYNPFLIGKNKCYYAELRIKIENKK